MSRIPWPSLLRRTLIGCGIVWIVAASPPLRTAAGVLEPNLLPVAFLLALAGGVAGAWARWRGRLPAQLRLRSVERAVAVWLGRWGWTVAVLMALAPLWSHWDMRPTDQTAAFSAQVGFVPWKDARRHLEGGLRLLDEGVIGAFSERRPLNATWLAVRIGAARGNLNVSLAVQAVLFGLTLYLLGSVVGRRFGPWPAVALVVLLHSFVRGYLPTFNTEPFGVTLAALGVALLLSRSARARLSVLAAGVFLVGIALGVRPGPQFLLPALAVWGIFVHRARLRQALAVLTLAVVAAGISPLAVNALYGSGEGSYSSYPAYTFYGLTTGSNFRQVRADFGEEVAFSVEEREVAQRLWREGFANVREHPERFLGQLAANGTRFFGKLPGNIVPLADVGPLFRRHPLDGETRPTPAWSALLARVAVIVALLLFVLRLVRRSDRVGRGFWVATFAGILLSVPFVYGDAGFRGLAVTYPLLAAALSLGLASRERELPTMTTAGEPRLVRTVLALAVLLVVAALVGPPLARAAWPRPARQALAGFEAGKDMVVAVETTPRVLVSRRRLPLGAVPSLQRREFLALLTYGGFVDDARIRRLPPPFVIASIYDFVSRRQYVLIAPASLAQETGGFIHLHVRPLGTGGKIYRAESWERLP